MPQAPPHKAAAFFAALALVGQMVLPQPLYAETPVSLQDWEPSYGDVFFVDTAANIGYLFHAHSPLYLSFPVATGQKRVMRYIGRIYFAATPVATWVVKSTTTQGDRTTFGPTGLFLRLYKDGMTSTSYGIHGYAYSDRWLAQESRYKSAGCIVVSEDVLRLLHETYVQNDHALVVVTTEGPERIVEELLARQNVERSLAL